MCSHLRSDVPRENEGGHGLERMREVRISARFARETVEERLHLGILSRDEG